MVGQPLRWPRAEKALDFSGPSASNRSQLTMTLAKLPRAAKFREGASICGVCLRASLLLLLFVRSAAVAVAVDFCGYVSDGPGGTLTAVDFPSTQFRYRIPVVPAWDFAAGVCVGSAEGQKLWCSVSRIYRPTNQADSPPPASLEVEDPLSVLVVDVAAGRRSGRLPFRASRLDIASGGSLLVAARTLEPTIVLYDLASDALREAVEVPGNASSVAASRRTNLIYTAFSSNTDSLGSIPALAIIDGDAARVVGTVELPRADRPELDYPYTILAVDDSEQIYLARPGQRQLEVVDGRLGRHIASLELPGVPLALTRGENGPASVYVRKEEEGGCDLLLVSLPDLQTVVSRRTDRCVSQLSISPDGSLAVGSLDTFLVTWSADLSAEVGRSQVTGGSHLVVMLPGGCPEVDPCVGDCDADGRVTVEEVVRAVRVGLGHDSAVRCLAADATGDSLVEIDEIIRAVRHLLEGCPG